jgi:hypothetical protein
LILSCGENTDQTKKQKLVIEWISTRLEPSHDLIYLTLVETIRIINSNSDTVSLTFFEDESQGKSCFYAYNPAQKDCTMFIIKNSDGNIKVNPLDTVLITLANFEYTIKTSLSDSIVYFSSVKKNLMVELHERKLFFELVKPNKIMSELMPVNSVIPQAKNYSIESGLSDSLILSIKSKFKPPINQ